MKNVSKISAVLLTAAMMAGNSALLAVQAEETNTPSQPGTAETGRGSMPGGQPGMPGGMMEQNGEFPGGKEGKPGDMGQFGMMIDTELVSEQIAALDDETVQSKLTALLEAYEDAQAAEQEDLEDETLREATAEAAAALQEALADAGIELSIGGPDGMMEQNGEFPGGKEGKPGEMDQFGMMIDTELVSEQIAALDDETVQSELTELLEAYEEAQAAEQADPEDEALKEASAAAAAALQDALAEAGIDTRPEGGEFKDGEAPAPDGNTTGADTELPERTEEAQNNQEAKGFMAELEALFNKVKQLFGAA